MIKQLTLFCTFAIFMLAVGGAVTPVWAHADCDDPDGKGKHSPGHPHCGVVNEDSTDDGNLYLVWVDGVCDGAWHEEVLVCNGDWVAGACVNGDWEGDWDTSGVVPVPVCKDANGDVVVNDWEYYDAGIPPYIGHDPVGNFEKNVAVVVNLQHIDMDLSFLLDAFPVHGTECFRNAPVVGRQTVLEIFQEEDGTMAAVYVFSGYGYGTDSDKDVGYRVNFSSSVKSDLIPEWRPTKDRLRFDAVFTDWEMGGKRRNRCINGSGDLDTTISIEFLPPSPTP